MDGPGCDFGVPGLPSGLPELVKQAPEHEIYLVAGANARYEETATLAGRLAPLALDGLLFTKVDEAVVFGDVVNAVHVTGLPLTYFGRGRGPSQPLQVAQPRLVAELLFTWTPDLENLVTRG